MRCAVLQKHLEFPAIEKLQRAFRFVPGLAPADAHTIGADAFGILARDFSPGQAAAMECALRAEGIETEVVDMALLPALPPVKTVHRLDCTPENLVIYDPLNRPIPLAWQHVTMICAGAVVVSEFVSRRVKDFAAAKHGNPLLFAQQFRDSCEQRCSHLLADIMVAGGGLRYTFAADKFNFLGLGDRRTRDVTANFVTFVRNLAGRAGHAVRNLGVEALLRNELLEYPTKGAFQEEITWRLFQMKRPA
jgi:hypothetical protein